MHGEKEGGEGTDAEAPVAAGGYQRRLVYERAYDRVFLDVVSREDMGERLMRIPSEHLARYLDSMDRAVRPSEPDAREQGLDTLV